MMKRSPFRLEGSGLPHVVRVTDVCPVRRITPGMSETRSSNRWYRTDGRTRRTQNERSAAKRLRLERQSSLPFYKITVHFDGRTLKRTAG